MTPSFTPHSQAHGGLSDAMLAGKAPYARALDMSFSTNDYLSFCEFGSAMIAPAWVMNAALPLGIAHVIELGRKREMCWTNAETVVAGMHDDSLSRMSSRSEVEHQAVSEPRLPLEAGAPISTRTSASGPEPAVVSLVDVFVESVDGVGKGESVVPAPSLHGGILTSLKLGVK